MAQTLRNLFDIELDKEILLNYDKEVQIGTRPTLNGKRITEKYPHLNRDFYITGQGMNNVENKIVARGGCRR